MKTKERILHVSLGLFNRLGERNVTTNLIAEETDISPGNLYYHYRSKGEIIECLYDRFETQMGEALDTPPGRIPALEDTWSYLHKMFEAVWAYRFIYRDLNNLINKNEAVAQRFRKMVRRMMSTTTALFNGMVEENVMTATPMELDALVTNISVISTFWLNFESVCGHADPSDERANFGRAIYQVLALVAPYLHGDARQLLERLSAEYLSE